jgi:DNA mismatch endonuclease (patch repair protein)
MPKDVPPPSSPAASNRMKANVSKGTGPEISLRRALRKAGLVGYRLNYRKAPGSPDIVYVKKRIAIFVHGCFWHDCPKCNKRLPKSNRLFWQRKIRRNKERDKKKEIVLRAEGWAIKTVWECEIERDIDNVVREISRLCTIK